MAPIYIWSTENDAVSVSSVRQINHLLFPQQQNQLMSKQELNSQVQTEALSPVAVRCITALEACKPAHPHRIDAEDDYPRLIFHRHFESEASLAEQTLQTAGLVALLTT